jgi:hypothetical protein
LQFGCPPQHPQVHHFRRKVAHVGRAAVPVVDVLIGEEDSISMTILTVPAEVFA